jgi:hypothetical protein
VAALVAVAVAALVAAAAWPIDLAVARRLMGAKPEQEPKVKGVIATPIR